MCIFVSNAAEVEVTPCPDTLNVSYTVNSLPPGNNEASLNSLVVAYQAILRSGCSGTRTVALNGRAAVGVVSLSGLARNTPYRVTYRVEIAVSFQVTLPSDIADPVEESTGPCPGQCSIQHFSTVIMWSIVMLHKC